MDAREELACIINEHPEICEELLAAYTEIVSKKN